LEEVLEVLRTFNATDGHYCSGTTSAGLSFYSLPHRDYTLADLPPAQDIESCEVSVMDSEREIEVTLGPGGIVVDKRLSPGVWEYRWDKAYRELRDKPYKRLLTKYGYRYRYLACVLAAGLLLASAWIRLIRAPVRSIGSPPTDSPQGVSKEMLITTKRA